VFLISANTKTNKLMNPNEVRAQRQRKQDERRLSLQKSNAYFSFVSTAEAATTKASAVVDLPRSLAPTPSNELKPIPNE